MVLDDQFMDNHVHPAYKEKLPKDIYFMHLTSLYALAASSS